MSQKLLLILMSLMTLVINTRCTHMPSKEVRWLQSAAKGELSQLQTLFEKEQLPIDFANEMGTTAMMAAASRGHTAVMEWLLENQADLEKKDTHGQRAIEYAIYQSKVASLKWLKTKNASWVRGSDEPSLLMIAARNSSLETVKELLNWPLPKNAFDTNGWTAVHHCISRKNINILTLLIAEKVTLETHHPKTESVLFLAVESQWHEGVDLLLKAGGNAKRQKNSSMSPCSLSQKIGFTTPKLQAHCTSVATE